MNANGETPSIAVEEVREDPLVNAWIEQIFGAQSAQSGGVVCRSKYDVSRYASKSELVEAVRSRDFT